MRRVRDKACQRERRRARLDPAAVAAHVDLDMHRQARDAGFGGGGFEVGDLCRVVDADADMRGMGQRHQVAQLLPADHLVGDQHVAHPAIDHRLGLADLLDAHPDRA